MKFMSTYRSRKHRKYDTLEVFGPEHEFSIVDETLNPKPIVDKVIKKFCGRIKNNVVFPDFIFGKELQAHVAEIKAKNPFRSPQEFENKMQKGVDIISTELDGLDCRLLGLGMHPTVSLDEIKVWSHRDRKIYDAFDTLFNLKQHGWLNIQSFQLNLSYLNEFEAIKLYNLVKLIIPYLPAISASSPIYEGEIGEYRDNRLHFYGLSQEKIPSITGYIVPEPLNSFRSYKEKIINRYSSDLERAGAPSFILNKDWINSRGAIFRFDRKTIEIRIMDEQECIKSDVALSCFIRSLLRGLVQSRMFEIPYHLLVDDLNAVIKDGLRANVNHPTLTSAKEVCRSLFKTAYKNALQQEKKYLWIIKRRIEEGNISELIVDRVLRRAQRTDFKEALIKIYSDLTDNLKKNQVYL